MTVRTSDIVSISEARTRLRELADEVAREGTSKVLTRNGASYVALIDARRLDRLHELEREFDLREFAELAARGMEDVVEGRIVESDVLEELLDDPERLSAWAPKDLSRKG